MIDIDHPSEYDARLVLAMAMPALQEDMLREINTQSPITTLQHWLNSTDDSLVMRRLRAIIDNNRVDEMQKLMVDHGIRFITPADKEWPAGLNDLGAQRPVGLWVTGKHLHLHHSVAVTGSRAVTSYGEHVAQEIATAVSDIGWRVVTGGSYGVEDTASSTALTIAEPNHSPVLVSATGVLHSYPTSRQQLLQDVATDGTVISEYPMDTMATRQLIQRRNIIMVAMTPALIVIQASPRSGVMATAQFAQHLERTVMAVPGSVTSIGSRGSNQLIVDGTARPILDAQHAADVLNVLY